MLLGIDVKFCFARLLKEVSLHSMISYINELHLEGELSRNLILYLERHEQDQFIYIDGMPYEKTDDDPISLQ